MIPGRTWTLWLLLLALPVYGFSGVATQLLGSTHAHRTASIEAAQVVPLDDFRRLGGHVRSTVEPHSHRLWQRHRHATGDASVVALDSSAEESAAADAAATAGATCMPLGTGASGAIGVPYSAESVRCWPPAGHCLIASVTGQPLERPPKA